MAILSTIKDRVATGLMTAADKGANLIAKASSLSSAQLIDIEERRKYYMSELPETDPDSIKRLLGSYAIEAYEAYLPQISQLYEPINLELENDQRSLLNRIRYFEITKWVTDPSEDSIEKLVNVYQVINQDNCNMALVYNRQKTGCKVFLAIVNNESKDNPEIVDKLEKRIISAMSGNFPGSEIRLRDENSRQMDLYGIGVLPCLSNSEGYSVASVSNIATEKTKNFANQRMEKLLDGLIPKDESEEYSIILLAAPILEQLERKNALSELYSSLAPFASWQTNFTYTEHKTDSSSATFGTCLGASAGRRSAYQEIEQHRSSNEIKESDTERNTEEKLIKQYTSYAEKAIGKLTNKFDIPLPFIGEFKAEFALECEKSKGTEQVKNNIKQKINEKIESKSNSIDKLYQNGKHGIDLGMNFGVNFSRSSNVSVTIGKNEGLTQTFTNHGVKYTLEMLEKQIKRLEESSALGMWDFSAYFISKSPIIVNNAAQMYLALTQGNESYLSQSAINIWIAPPNKKYGDISKQQENDRKINNVKSILDYIKRLQHPQFQMRDDLSKEWLMYPPHVSTTVSLTGRELARALNFPKKSISGMPVIECASFGREVNTYEIINDNRKRISLGHAHHMHKDEKEVSVELNLDSLTSHTFITGSTGTGKSNSVYQLLDKARKSGVHFLVIEPAKGEYKECLGSNVHVLGTNSNETELLYINPFSFPDGIHVLEHIDRLVEILNACWPMYAAMPAVLKDSIERVYINKGWNLQKSKCVVNGIGRFPTFSDLLTTLPEVMEDSSYSADTKSDYAGALITRVKSLTNGLNGQLLCSGLETSDKTLFEEDTIIDLSRIGSMETRSLFMGILVMKLQEFHMNRNNKANDSLNHLTVLEEAHNLLRRTSVAQTQESSNLQGKSVEMITNSIAEMRTYGEGFVIVDQAPGLLDEAVIRNTNTKIILRLPDYEDRITVGKSAALNEEQIDEIAKLPRGVAVIYQNNWIEAVLCHFEKFNNQKPYKKPGSNIVCPQDLFCRNVFKNNGFKTLKSEDVDSLLAWIESSRYARETKRIMTRAVNGNNLSEREKQLIAYNVFDGKLIASFLSQAVNEKEGIKKADSFIRVNSGIEDVRIVEMIRQMIIQMIYSHNRESDLARRYVEYAGTLR